jgi:hypothetical protein
LSRNAGLPAGTIQFAFAILMLCFAAPTPPPAGRRVDLAVRPFEHEPRAQRLDGDVTEIAAAT